MNFLYFCSDCGETFISQGSPAVVCRLCQGDSLDLLIVSQIPVHNQFDEFDEFGDDEDPDDDLTSEALSEFVNELGQLHPAGSLFGKFEDFQVIEIDQSHVDRELECVICMSNNEVGDKVLELHCAHMFHEECLRKWLEEHSTCPLCREPVVNQSTAGTWEEIIAWQEHELLDN